MHESKGWPVQWCPTFLNFEILLVKRLCGAMYSDLMLFEDAMIFSSQV